MEILRGNFTTKELVKIEPMEQTLEQKFELAAMKRLGGSIAYVAKHKVNWGNQVEEQFKK